ncbi:hypothetical protein [uncultured Plantibacter sp.]|uniref:hypothetical protein n=1 Tax=uncultured Plantibacter sp. TaxID=293337 RepID=UPI0028D0C7DC|nr:hypothetical protein [uncultured Plantibacter sp.]
MNNPASCGVAIRAGFLPEGIERQKLAYGADRFDVELHARLATDPVPDGDLLLPIREEVRSGGVDLPAARVAAVMSFIATSTFGSARATTKPSACALTTPRPSGMNGLAFEFNHVGESE